MGEQLALGSGTKVYNKWLYIGLVDVISGALQGSIL